MSETSDDETIILYYFYRKQRNRRNRRYWVHPYIKRNIKCRLFVAAKELQQTDAKFLSLYRMSKESYTHLVELLVPHIHQRDTHMRECVSAEERILITIRYLATGATFTSISLYFARGDSTVSRIIGEITAIIWDALKDIYMPTPDKNQWKIIAQRFHLLWNLPNCLGALDGKHIRIEKLPNSGSLNFNYKSYHSIVLMACSDADGLFTYIETGFAGRNSDGGIFRASAIKHFIEGDNLDLPTPLRLPNDDNNYKFPFYFVGDEAFPLLHYLLRPYPQRVLDNTKRIFNYRLSRGRKTVECAFGMMTEKFQVLSTAIRCHDNIKINNIVKSVCILHNYVRKREGLPYRAYEENSNSTHGIIQPQKIQLNAQSSPKKLFS
ncbi:unnamed protein product [Acanthoscelides obtectus]|uniref:DDE Tnp4 domain-containing protein n=1 Tax=Acanthoscelides obtectus TaxID=200917 RepID=A0A9P0M577_ACAOB|nr:unnamed protein product [Acanthoscelides obtectus]CAK1666779.1 Protein ALP1-like [Acanthoscelides obtectus]